MFIIIILLLFHSVICGNVNTATAWVLQDYHVGDFVSALDDIVSNATVPVCAWFIPKWLEQFMKSELTGLFFRFLTQDNNTAWDNELSYS